jgi:RimJ/RimL family protein N-acetyltransferase
MVIEGRRLILRSIEVSDLPTLWRWRNSEEFRNLCSVRRNSLSIEEFDLELGNDFARDRHEQFLILRKVDERAVGTIYSYNFSAEDGHAFVTMYIDSEHVARGYGATSFALFCRHLFLEYGLFKVYTEVYAYNEASLSVMLNGGLVEEGCFKNHRLVNGKRWNLVRLALYRGQMNEVDRIAKS